ncbi:MAG: hypothetical protein ACLPKI_21490 [Streptosporangiaceae bacterium]
MASTSRDGGARPGPGEPAGARAGRAGAEQIESRVTVAPPEAVLEPGDLPAVVPGLRIEVAEQTSFQTGQG